MYKLTLSLIIGFTLFLSAQSENDYYTITDIPIPKGIVFEVSDIEILPNKQIAACSRRGDIYIIDNAYDNDPSNDKWTLFATGLHEPLGLSYHKGWLWCVQRPEVTRMKDLDGDGRADHFECISDDWGINGNYHEYAFGSKHDKDGNIWIVLCLTGSFTADSDFRGWCVRVGEDGKMIPTTSGIRSPGGIGFNAEGDVFYSDNQGKWNGTSSVKHLKVGSFQGAPVGNPGYELTNAIGQRPVEPIENSRVAIERTKIKQLVPPACNMPHMKIGKSTSGMDWDKTEGKFGPFPTQLFVNDQSYSSIARLALEKVNGVYQGACFPFLEGFGSGNLPLTFDKDQACAFVGGTNRGWGAKGNKAGSLERVNWTGKTPFEVHHIKITKEGFILNFTEAISSKAFLNKENLVINANTWLYRSAYGSPEVDITTPTITDLKMGDDNKSLIITLDKIYKGHTYNFEFKNYQSDKGNKLLHTKAYYTVNEVLGQEFIHPPEVVDTTKKKKK